MNEDQRRVDLAKAVKTMKEEWPALQEYVLMQTKIARHRYLCLIEQGFSEAQALELCHKAIQLT